MSRQQRAQQQASLSAFLASQSPASITEETVRHSYHEFSALYKCWSCGVAETKEKKHLQCSRCKQGQYCSKECQLSHWKEHKGMCKLLSDTSESMVIEEDLEERFELFKEKYVPMLQMATLWELDESAEDMIIIFELEDLPAECKAPRIGIKSFRLESIRSQQDFVQEFRTKCLIQVPPIDCRITFAMVLWPQAIGEPIKMWTIFPFTFVNKNEDRSILEAAGLTRDMQIEICHQKASQYVKTINDMARGRNKKLSQAAKPRRR